MSVPACVQFVRSDKIQAICKGYKGGTRPCVGFRTEGRRLVIYYCSPYSRGPVHTERVQNAVKTLLGDRFEPQELQSIINRLLPENLSFCK
jgi:hypothetical protein